MSTSIRATVNKPGCDAPPSTSTVVVSEACGNHILKVETYSRIKMMAAIGEEVSSGKFHVGGHNWCIVCYPSGYTSDAADFIAVYVRHLGRPDAADLHAELYLSLIDHDGQPVLSHRYGSTYNFKTYPMFGYSRFIKRETLEKSGHLKDDCFAVRCDLTVAGKELRVEPLVAVPPPALSRHFGELLRSKVGADVRFKVGRETFPAHRCILAARSPVFHAELLGSMKEHDALCVRIDDMEPPVFRALLHFVYTDALPAMEKEEVTATAQHLLVAAYRYGMDRLKAVCEDNLCSRLEAGTAATTLALAEQHSCPRLKEAIFGFLMTSPANLSAFLESEGFPHLDESCPSLTTELLKKIAKRDRGHM